MGPPAIHYVSHFHASGYGVAARRLFRGLADIGVALRWTPIEFDEIDPILPDDRPSDLDLDAYRFTDLVPDVVVLHSVPELLPHLQHLRPPGKALVLHTVWEHQVLQAHWPDLLNRFDAIVVPTEWNADAFVRAGVRVPIAVVPHAASQEQADSAWLLEDPIRAGDTFLVHSIATWSVRKTPWVTLEAYARAFRTDDDVLLVLRTSQLLDDEVTSPPGPPNRTRLSSWSASRILHRHHPAPRVYLATEQRTFEQIAGLHFRSDCWLSLPRAEGWDLGAFDAACAGTPVITTAHGGPLEYLSPEACLLIPGELVPLGWLPGATWMRPDVDAAVDALRTVRARPDALLSAAHLQGERLRARHAPQVVAQQFLDALEAMGIS
jgi:glycosyltransferase involved in cell wall biosynthesis